MSDDCPFCGLGPDRVVDCNDLAVAVRDGFPVSPGHSLVIPRRHVETWFDASPWEQQAIFQLVEEVKRKLDLELQPHGYNVGFNAGKAAGQTVMHLHVHVIPRFHGDMPDPRGGVRGVIPSRQKYGSSNPSAEINQDPFASLESFIPGENQHFRTVLQRAINVADEIDLLAAFVQKSGIDAIELDLIAALERGARIRVLTGDYLGVTHPHALQRLYTLATGFDGFQARLFRTGSNTVFHPKAYIFSRGTHGVAFVGSSNLSHSALTDGVEWNLRATRADEETFVSIRDRFHSLFHSPHSETLTAELVGSYQHIVRVPPQPEPASNRPRPRDLQVEVLAALQKARERGERRGLVVMATGLGKTYLSAFDFEQQGGRRALFVAHRDEILQQAALTWSEVLPDRSVGFWKGDLKEPDADLLFASVQTLSRAVHLRNFSADHFDYIVIDEFHHAAATSYRKLLARFEPSYLLGLTATPDRMDGVALLELCDDNLVARIGLIEGIHRGHLVPFRYFGVRDEIDFEQIPWRSGRFDLEALTQAAATEERANQALREYLRHGAPERRALVFCCSTRHADFVADHFRRNGVKAAAVHSGPTSAARAQSLQELRTGELEAIVAVDIFNEGVDLPDINTILMLRPTESPIIFMQQLGRGLRKGRMLEKPALTVIDFIGNHRSFLAKPQALLALTGQVVAPGDAIRRLRNGLLELSAGCTVDVETEALDILEKVARISKDDHLRYTYAQLRDSLARRPTAREIIGAGANLSVIRQRFTSWFDFVDAQGDLSLSEKAVLDGHREWFSDLMKTMMTRSYKMVNLEVMDDHNWLHGQVEVDRLAVACRDRMTRDPLLLADLKERASLDKESFVRRWREMPLKIFHEANSFSRQWFELRDKEFVSRLNVEESQREVFDAMTAELVEMRLWDYSVKNLHFADNIIPFAAPIELGVSHASGNPILRFDRKLRPDIPEGEVLVRVDGELYTFRFNSFAVHHVSKDPGGVNVLPQLMRGWFGPTAGQPGTRHRVELHLERDGNRRLSRRESNSAVESVIPLNQVPFYRDLDVACGHATVQYEGHDVSEPIVVETKRRLDATRHFVVRATGNSMNGGEAPICDGDLVLCELTTVSSPDQVDGKPVLLTGGRSDEVQTYLKMPVRQGNAWVLRSANPEFPDLHLNPDATLRVVAKVLEVVHEASGPMLWGRYDRDAIAALFGQENKPQWKTGHCDVYVNGEPHSVFMVNLKKSSDTPVEHLYADKFLSPDEFQWESQATTAESGAKGQRIVNQARDGRHVHLFVRYHGKNAEGKGETFVYCGTIQYLRHEGEKPMRVWYRLDHALPLGLWHAWSGL